MEDLLKLPAGFDGQYSSLSGAPTNISSFTNDAGYLKTEVDGSVTNELQTISISTDTIKLSNGGFVKLLTETDPEVGSNTTNYLSKWDGAALITSSVYDNGNVGIGTTNPDAKFHVKDGAYNLKFGIDHGVTLDEGMGYGWSGSWPSTIYGKSGFSDGFILFKTRNDEKMRLTSQGNLGIGTDNPSTTLDVNGIITATDGNSTNWNTAYGWGNHSGLYRPVTYVPAWSEITSNPFSFTSTANNQLLKFNSVSGKWENWTPDYLTGFTETDPAWTAVSGNYYTKTNMQTSGASELHFNNLTNKPTTLPGYGITDAMTTAHAANGITPVLIGNWDAAFSWGDHSIKGYFANGGEATGLNRIIGNSDDFSLGFKTNNATRMLISKEGKIGIGTNTPAQLLHISDAEIPANGLDDDIDGQADETGEELVFTNRGRMGIKTTSPSTTLDVNGIITATDGTSTNWNTAFGWGNHATAGYLTGFTETDPVFGVSPAKGITTSDINSWNNKLASEVDGSVTNEIQILSRSNDTIYLSNGGFVKLPAGFDGQYSSLSGAPVNVSSFTNDAGYLITEFDGSVTNEIQALSLSNDSIYLSEGGSVKLPAESDPEIGVNTTNYLSKWNGSALVASSVFENGNVGIGTTDPGWPLDVNGQIRLNSHIISNNVRGSLILNSGPDNSSEGLSGIFFRKTNVQGDPTNYTELVRITDAGKMGIGTTSPIEKLQINDGTNKNLGIRNGDWLFGNEGIGFTAHNDEGSLPVPFGFAASKFAFMGGNVGIGTVNPVGKLTVNHGVDRNLSLFQGIAGYGSEGSIVIAAHNDPNNNFVPLGFGAGKFVFFAGNVGIGTENPLSKLDVNGSIRAGNYFTGAGIADINAFSMELGGEAPDPTNGQATLYLHDFGTIAHQLRYTNGTLYLEEDGSGYGSNSTPNLNVGGTVNASNLTINGVPVGTSSDSYWSWNPNGGGNTYLTAGQGVGIGTSSPLHKLDVVGYINTDVNSGYKIDGYTILKTSTSNYHTLVGRNAGVSLTAGASFNVAVGYSALGNSTNADFNTAVGVASLNDSNGSYNSAFGASALQVNNLGYKNTALGVSSLYKNTDGNYNTGVGNESLLNNTVGSNNTVIGYQAGYGNVSSTINNSVLIGYHSGYALSNGSNNLLIGYQSGDDITSGENNIVIGYDLSTPAPTTSNHLNIGNLVFGDLSAGKAGIGTANPQYKLDVAGDVNVTGNFKVNGTDIPTSPADGSETKVTSGTNVTVTGSGTVGSPYVINTSGGGGSSHYIGESYGGGIIFYLYDNGQHGLICATVDQSAGIIWNNGTYTVTNAVRDGIAAGKSNTERIITNQGAGAYAAQLTANYSGSNFGDWYMPSKYELNLLYLQKDIVGGLSGIYWSSTEVNNEFANIQLFNDGMQMSLTKTNTLPVRAIRAF
ncbi:hypothetical protein LDC_1544 [sediment metagenome]|uniref:Uncharacterized protein n=1 Tax=sediment metagenome TaxID=749907 RepID=D9PJ35_9ZZZZ